MIQNFIQLGLSRYWTQSCAIIQWIFSRPY